MPDPSSRFAARTDWDLELNPLAALRERLRAEGRNILDLTESNPTRCGFEYDGPGILEALSDPRALVYDPQPRGLLAAREAVAAYYTDRGLRVGADQILLTSGSSEAYGFLFRLLCNPGDNVLVPRPGYPLFDFLARLHDIEQAEYDLEYYRRWEIDFGSLDRAVNARTRAVIAINPNNPTGSVLKPAEREMLMEFCRRYGLALITDEVFHDYCLPHAAPNAGSMAGTKEVLSFTLNGLSKTAALPQLKLGWIVASGPHEVLEPALAKLEIIADTYLSVGAPVQHAAGRLLAGSAATQRQIRRRVEANLERLDERLAGQSLCTRLEVEAGWSVVLRVPSTRGDEEWALTLLDRDEVLVHPGHFFRFAGRGYLVLSLLEPEDVLDEGIGRLLTRINCA